MRVRDLDGKDLGRVTALYDEAFAVEKGFPILFRQDLVVRYDEVRGERDGRLVVARSEGALLDLARGELPDSWLIPAPPDYPTAATPGEARGVFAELAGARAAAAGGARRDEGVGAEPQAAPDDEDRRDAIPLPPAAHP